MNVEWTPWTDMTLKPINYYSSRVFPSSPVSWSGRIHQLHLCRGVRPSPLFQSSVLDMTLNHLSFRECGVPLHYHYSQVHFGLLDRVFTNGLGDLGSISGCVIPKTLKMVLNTSLLNTQQYKVRIKDNVEQSRERSSALPYTSV